MEECWIRRKRSLESRIRVSTVNGEPKRLTRRKDLGERGRGPFYWCEWPSERASSRSHVDSFPSFSLLFLYFFLHHINGGCMLPLNLSLSSVFFFFLMGWCSLMNTN
ncbi:hypothetical protein CIPAW_06G059400 [Carya illinoinensis]|uniref:Transmembrane protein n=1 Tax=Carya illinoinensis TaxID=32201 RepID=A0A8T1Q8C4_CARIL|nr:hypothetical protein CIPAW_06G059400 [Carya illinoinensis]